MKYQRLIPGSGCKEKGKQNFEFVVKAQIKVSLYLHRLQASSTI